MPANIIGLGLVVAAIVLMIMGGVVMWILGVICLVGGIGALFMTYRRRKQLRSGPPAARASVA